MIIKGIKKGDKELRHFTFDDGEYTLKNGVYYYKVNYGKNTLEGPDAEDEIGFVAADMVIPLGGRRPRPIPGRGTEEKVKSVDTPKPVETVEKPKRGRPAKVTKTEPGKEIIPVAGEVYAYEYYVAELKITDTTELQNELNELGSQGWELCCYDVDRSLFSNTLIRMIFKRKRG